jgi:hypothetical protein
MEFPNMRSALLNAAAATALLVTAAVAQTPSTGGDAGQNPGGEQMNQGDTAGQGATTTQDATPGGNTAKGTAQGTDATTCVPGQPNCPTEAGAADANAPSADGQDTTTEQTGMGAGAAQQGADQQGDAQQQGQTEPDQAGEPAPATAPAEITPQHTKVIRERIVERRDYARVNIDIEINIGVGVPRHIEFYPLPPEIIEIVPIYEGYLFCILEDGTILIIHPAEYEIVYVIYA